MSKTFATEESPLLGPRRRHSISVTEKYRNPFARTETERADVGHEANLIKSPSHLNHPVKPLAAERSLELPVSLVLWADSLGLNASIRLRKGEQGWVWAGRTLVQELPRTQLSGKLEWT